VRLTDAKSLVDAEPGTLARFGFRFGPSSVRIFDAVETEEDHEAHLQGRCAGRSLRGDERLAVPPTITPVGLPAAKLPPH
jgi:hypothetical protein